MNHKGYVWMKALQSRALSLILHQLPVNTRVPLKIETIRHRVFSNRIQIDFFERATSKPILIFSKASCEMNWISPVSPYYCLLFSEFFPRFCESERENNSCTLAHMLIVQTMFSKHCSLEYWISSHMCTPTTKTRFKHRSPHPYCISIELFYSQKRVKIDVRQEEGRNKRRKLFRNAFYYFWFSCSMLMEEVHDSRFPLSRYTLDRCVNWKHDTFMMFMVCFWLYSQTKSIFSPLYECNKRFPYDNEKLTLSKFQPLLRAFTIAGLKLTFYGGKDFTEKIQVVQVP